MTDITYKQFKSLYFISFLALNFITFPSKLAANVSTDGVICLLVSALIGYLGCAITFKVMLSHPNHSFFEILKIIFGKFWGKVMLIIYIIHIVQYTAYFIRLISEQIVVFILREHPLFLIEIILFLTVILIVTRRLRTLGNLSQILVKVILVCLTLLTVLTARTMILENMLPLFTTKLSDYAKGILVSNSYLFSANIALPFFIPFVKNINEQNVYKDFFKLIMGVFLIFSVFYVWCIGILGVESAKEFIFSAFSIVQSDNARNVFFERFEVILILIVVEFSVMYSSVMMRSIKMISEEIFEKKKAKIVSLMLLILTVSITFFLNGQTIGRIVYEFYNSSNFILPHSLLPIIVYIAYSIKTKRRVSDA